MTIQKFSYCSVVSVSALALGLATSGFAAAQTITLPNVPLSDVNCNFPLAPPNSVFNSPPCTNSGNRTTTPTTGTVTPIAAQPGRATANGQWAVSHTGDLVIDAIPIAAILGQPSTQLDASGFFDPGAATVNVTASYTGQFNNLNVPDTVSATAIGYFPQYLDRTTTVNSINVNVANGEATDTSSGINYTYNLSSANPTTIVGGNGVNLSGNFTNQGNSSASALVFGTLSGTANVVSANVVTPGPQGTNTNWFSPFGLTYNVIATETTKLDQTGLVTPTVSVTNGINLNGSKVSNVADGTAATDAVNLGQLNAALASDFVVVNGSGSQPTVSGANAIAMGSDAQAAGASATALGAGANASNAFSAAIGAGALATGAQGVAIGRLAVATQDNATAVGTAANATGSNSTAVGFDTKATGAGAFASGLSATASGNFSAANGFVSQSTGFVSTAIGAFTNAAGNASVAIGADATTVNSVQQTSGNIAIGASTGSVAGSLNSGTRTTANGGNSVAIGTGAQATHAGATALGAGAATTADNQVRIGTASNSISLPGLLTTSDAAQSGQEFFVTVDNNGTLGKGAQSSAAISQLGNQVASLQSGQALIDDQVAALQQGQAALGRGLTQANGGIAAAMAMGGMMIVPDSNVSVNFNLSTYRGQQGFAGGVAARVAPRIYVSGGFAGSTVKGSTGGRVGVAFGF